MTIRHFIQIRYESKMLVVLYKPLLHIGLLEPVFTESLKHT